MFSQFMTPGGRVIPQVLFLTLALALVNIPNHFVWGYIGDLAARQLNSGQRKGKANRIFAVMLLSVSIYVLMA
jgi:threonine/homoserine/homoserine lactone efflux protein